MFFRCPHRTAAAILGIGLAMLSALASAQARIPACSADAQLDAANRTALQPKMDSIAALQSKRDLGKYLALARNDDNSAFFQFAAVPNSDDPTQMLPSISPGGLGMKDIQSYTELGAEQQQARFEYVTRIVETLRRAGETQAQASEDASTIMQLETALARVSGKTTATPNYLRMPRGDLAKLAPVLDWDAFLSNAGFAAANYVNVAHPDFLLGLNTVLNHEDLQQIRAYLRWHLLMTAPVCR